MTDTNFYETFQGSLQKYTNVVKGWCPRWFFLNPIDGTLSYYLSESEFGSNKTRGTLSLHCASVSPSEEDGHTFTVQSSSNSDSFKLRACDAKERQEWVNRLRAVIEKLDASTSGTRESEQRSAAWRPIPPSPWENYTASVYLPATNPTPRVTDWANAHSEADQQLRLVGDLFDLVQRETDELTASREMSSCHRDVVHLASTSLFALHTLQDAIRLLENEAYRPSVLE